MPTYAYQAVDGSGKRTRGQAQAASSGALARTLEERGLFVLDVAESNEAAGARRGFRLGRRREVLEVTRALAALLPERRRKNSVSEKPFQLPPGMGSAGK